MKLQRCNSRSFSNSSNEEEEKSQSIPFDLVMEILMRLPSKSIARFRCVSKVWDSTLVSPEFIEYFNTISASRPKLLFTCLKDGKTFFFSSPKPKDSSPLAVNIHMSFPINRPHEIFRPVRGLVCGLNQHTTKRGTVNMPLICNPSTGETVPLPILKTRRKRGVTSYLGYDPIDKQFKVLCMTHSRNRPFWSHEVEVLTLGTGTNPSWRVIGCDIPHERVLVDRISGHSAYDGICINGVLYYLAYLLGEHTTGVVCFEFRSEKFNCIRLAEGMGSAYSTQSTLVNYKGKLALLLPNIVPGVQLWVLEDAETHQWSSFIYLWSPRKKIVAKTNSGKKIRKNIKLRNVGTLHTKKRYVVTTDTGKIVWSPEDISDSFYLLYYNPERNTATSIRIKGMEAFKEHKAYTFLDHVEDLRQVSKIVGS